MMSRRALCLTVVLLFAAGPGCAKQAELVSAAQPGEKRLDFGAHRLQVVVPAGWEALDQGRQKRFRKGERQIVLQNLGAPTPPARDLNELIEWGLASVGSNERREIKTRQITAIDGRAAVDIETWSRLDHSYPQKITFVKDGDEVFAVTTEGMAFEDSLTAFDVIRSSIHFVSGRQ
jgi:hypothetical protein